MATLAYIPHGGGPLPLLDDPGHEAMVAGLRSLAASIPQPEAVIVVSAHWEAPQPTLTAASNPGLIYDYYGFPPASYQIRYPAPGQPSLAHRVGTLIQSQGAMGRQDLQRGFDHGLFVPMKILFPEAQIPCIQLSLLDGLDPDAHLALGEALQPLLGENLLILGSGHSFHNLKALMNGVPANGDPANEAFQRWLIETLTGALSPRQRRDRLRHWHRAPHALYCHPRCEHLLPLHVCAGAAGCRKALLAFDDQVMGKRATGFLWEFSAAPGQ